MDGQGLRVQVEGALQSIPDPELGIDILNLGLIQDILIDADANVCVQYGLTRLGCPAAPLLHEAIIRTVNKVPGVRAATAEFVLDPPWTPDRMSTSARFDLLGVF